MAFLKNNRVVFIQLVVWLLLIGLAALLGKQAFGGALNESIYSLVVRYGLLAFAMIATIKTSAGLNLGLPIGMICGNTAVILAIAGGFVGVLWLLITLLIALVLSAVIGFGYGKLLSRIKGSGGTNLILTLFIGMVAVAIINYIFMMIPFKNMALSNPNGIGLRMTIEIPMGAKYILSDFLRFSIGKVDIPFGLLFILAVGCFAVWYFLLRNKGIITGEEAERVAAIDANKGKDTIIAAVSSTALGAIAAIILAQDNGVIMTYTGTATSAMLVAAAVLLGGVTLKKASIRQVVIGVLLFSGLYWQLIPAIGNTLGESLVLEYLRMAVLYLIIVCALLRLVWRRKVDEELEG
jgi:simple sugar transport system permease protein